jgi:hypothetical protein
MRVRTVVLAAVAAVVLVAAAPARAGTALGLGADVPTEPEVGAFQLTLAVESRLARHLSLGGRFGALLATGPTRLGVPLDLRLRARLGRVYLDGLVGPWLVFDDGDVLRFHAGVGFGLLTRSFSFGLEVGWLDPTPMIGVRLAFPI